MKQWMKAMAIGAMVLAAMAGAGCGSEGNGKKQVAIVQLMEHKALDEANQGFKDGLKENGYGKCPGGPVKPCVHRDEAEGKETGIDLCDRNSGSPEPGQ